MMKLNENLIVYKDNEKLIKFSKDNVFNITGKDYKYVHVDSRYIRLLYEGKVIASCEYKLYGNMLLSLYDKDYLLKKYFLQRKYKLLDENKVLIGDIKADGLGGFTLIGNFSELFPIELQVFVLAIIQDTWYSVASSSTV